MDQQNRIKLKKEKKSSPSLGRPPSPAARGFAHPEPNGPSLSCPKVIEKCVVDAINFSFLGLLVSDSGVLQK